MRIFTGIRVSRDIREKISGVSKKLALKVREARIVSPENLHITLKFIGETPESRIVPIEEALCGIARNFEPFDLEVKGLGGFPEGKKIRVLWAGACSGGILKKINREIEEKLKFQGILPENRFREHITLARFKSAPSLSFVTGLIEAHEETSFGFMRVDRLELIESRLTGKSPVYITLAEIPLVRHNNR